MPARRVTRAVKAVKKPAVKKTKAAKPAAKAARKPAARKAAAAKNQPLDLSAFPPESVIQLEKWICLACVLDVFTRHMGLALKTANLEIRRYTPQLDEVNAPEATRPYFATPSSEGKCPYCGSPSKWLARLAIYRIESGIATDALRRQLVESLPTSDDQFVVLQEKATRQHAFFEWIEKVSVGLNLEDPSWFGEISRHYLSRKEPKVDWAAQMRDIHSIRRSRRLETPWGSGRGCLFLAPMLFDELLVVHYLVSRSQKAGGLTLEGRYTLPELVGRLRNSGYLRAIGINAHNPADVLEDLLDHLSGGQASVKFYHLVDRRGLLEKAKALRLVKPPKLKKLAAS